MSNESKSLYARIVKRLKQWRRVVLKKSDGSWSVCTWMNKNKIERTEFEADSIDEALTRANKGSHMRLSSEAYLDGKWYGDIYLYKTIDPEDKEEPQFESFTDVDEDREDVDDYINDDYDDDYDDSDDDYPMFTLPEVRPSKSILKRVTVG